MVAGMLMPLRDLRAIYEVLFRDGVIVAKKDKRPQTKHPEVESVSNLQVIRAMGSLKSRGFVKETFAWRHFYWYLTNEGIVYLRDYLHLPAEIVPASLQRVRKPAATLAIAHRAARVQSVEGPTSYVPKPGRRGEAESQEAVAERQGYRHKMMGTRERERETYSDRTPRFRGRPLAAEPVRPKASWEVEDQPQPLFRKGNSFRSETAVMEEGRVKTISHQQRDVRSERSVTVSQERKVYEVQKEKAPSVQVQRAALKQEILQTTLTSASSEKALPLTVAAEATGAATSKILAEPSASKTNKEKLKIEDETTSIKSGRMVSSHLEITTLPEKKVKEEKTTKAIVDPVKSAKAKATSEMVTDDVKPQTVITTTAAQVTSKPLSDTVTAAAVLTTSLNKDVKEGRTKKVTVDPVKPAEIKAVSEKTADEVKPQTLITMAAAQEISKPLSGTVAASPVNTAPVNKDVKGEKAEKVILDPVKPAVGKPKLETAIDKVKPQAVITVAAAQEPSKLLTDTVTTAPVITTPVNKDVKEEKTERVIKDPVKSAEVKAKPEAATERVKAQAVITVAASESSKPHTDSATATPLSTAPVKKDVKKEKTERVIKVPVESAEVMAKAEAATDKVKAQVANTALESSEPHTDTETATAVIITPVKKDVKEEKLKKTKANDESVKPAEVKTPVESKIDPSRAKKTAKLTATQDTTKPTPDSTTSEPVLPNAAVKEISKVKVTQEAVDVKVTSVNLSAKPKNDEVPQKAAMLSESSILEVKTTLSTTTLSAPVTIAEYTKPTQGKAPEMKVITKQDKTDVKVLPPVEKEEQLVPGEAPRVQVQGPSLAKKDSSSAQQSQNGATTEAITETKDLVEGRSKSKKKKKKSPSEMSKTIKAEEQLDSKLEEEKILTDKPRKEEAENTLQPTPVMTSESLTVCTSKESYGASPLVERKTRVEKNVDGVKIKEVPQQSNEKPVMEVLKQTAKQSISEAASLPLDQIPAVPPVELPNIAQVKERVVDSAVSKKTQGPVGSKDQLQAKLPHMEPLKSEEITVTEVETVTVQKITQVEIKQASPKPEEKILTPLTEPEKLIVETKSPVSTEKTAEGSSKGRKKGKGRKQVQTPASDTINTKPVFTPEAETLPSTNITSLPRDSPVTASEPSVPPKMTPERMCIEETGQAAAVLSEAPTDKGEVEPAPLCAKKIKREVPKPKTSSTAREAHAAGELASAAPVVTAEAAVAQAQASPLAKQEEPPKVAQHSASQAAERSTEKKLSVSKASEQEEEKKRDLEKDTPSATATPAAAQPDQPHLGDTCDSVNTDTDEAAMKRKIVVVEEIVEVKQLISPQATGEQSPPPPVQHEAEGEELDLDVLEAIAIERALLSGAAGVKVQGASPDEDWDHSLEEPEEKTWPNFVEGLFAHVPAGLLPILP